MSSGDDPIAIVWEAATGRVIRRLVGHKSPVTAVAFSPDGRLILTGSGSSDETGEAKEKPDNTARLWDAATGKELRRFVGRLEPGQSVTLDDGAAGEFLPGTAEALLSVSPRPDWDVPGLLRALDRYPYGCLEQTISRALPLLYVDTVAGLWRTDPGFSPAAAIDRAISHILELQRSDGSFGVWSESDDTVPWLDAYAADFLMRAKEHGKTVPDYALKSALGWLRDYVRQEHTELATLPATAYAHYVLARAQAGELGALRYFTDTKLSELPTQLAKAQLGAALAQYGDTQRASAAYAVAMGPPPKRPAGLRYVDYGSDLRDSAAALAFVASNPGAPPRLTATMDRIAELFARANRTSTQEQAWLLLAAETAVRATGGEMIVALGGAAPQTRGDPVYFRRPLGAEPARPRPSSGTTLRSSMRCLWRAGSTWSPSLGFSRSLFSSPSAAPARVSCFGSA